MAGWHHGLNGRESEWTPGVGDGQGGLACCNSWDHKESDTTQQLNWTDWILMCFEFDCMFAFTSQCFSITWFHVTSYYSVFYAWRTPFNSSYKAFLGVIIFCFLSEASFFHLQFRKVTLPGKVFLAGRLFWSILSHFHLTCKVSSEKPSYNLLGRGEGGFLFVWRASFLLLHQDFVLCLQFFDSFSLTALVKSSLSWT